MACASDAPGPAMYRCAGDDRIAASPLRHDKYATSSSVLEILPRQKQPMDSAIDRESALTESAYYAAEYHWRRG